MPANTVKTSDGCQVRIKSDPSRPKATILMDTCGVAGDEFATASCAYANAELVGVHQHTIRRAGASGELKLLKLSACIVGARESEFWRWVGRKSTNGGDA